MNNRALETVRGVHIIYNPCFVKERVSVLTEIGYFEKSEDNNHKGKSLISNLPQYLFIFHDKKNNIASF